MRSVSVSTLSFYTVACGIFLYILTIKINSNQDFFDLFFFSDFFDFKKKKRCVEIFILKFFFLFSIVKKTRFYSWFRFFAERKEGRDVKKLCGQAFCQVAEPFVLVAQRHCEIEG